MPVWGEDDRRRVELGEVTLAELAALRGVSRQAAHQAFRRRGWATGREWPEGGTVPEHQASAASPSATSAKATTEAEASAAPPFALIWGTDEDLAEIVRLEARNAGVLLVAKVRDQLAGPHPLSPQGAKMAAAALSLSVDLLERLGLPIAADTNQVVPRMVITEMTAAEIEATQAAAEAEHSGDCGGDDHDEPELDLTPPPEPASSPYGDGGALAKAEAPPAADTSLRASEPPCATDLKRLRRHLADAAERHGAVTLRSWCVAHGLPTARDADALADILLVHASKDEALLKSLLARLA